MAEREDLIDAAYIVNSASRYLYRRYRGAALDALLTLRTAMRAILAEVDRG